MTSFLVLSNRHHLLPLAQRLKGEGHEVDAVVWRSGRKHRYERAWDGVSTVLHKFSDGSFDERAVGALVDLAREGAATVVTDSYAASEQFGEAQRLFPAIRPDSPPRGPLRVGAWFNGERFVEPHLLVVDVGAWPGGYGPVVAGGLTLVRVDTPEALELAHRLLDEKVDELKSRSFRGLAQWDVVLATASGVPRLGEGEVGWPWLHTHAWLSEMPESIEEGLGAVLGGSDPVLPQKFVVVLPVTVPPWPTSSAHPGESMPVEGLTAAQRGRVFWHDICVREGRLYTAGLDGLVGVVRGAASSVDLARARALGVAGSVVLPERQLRPDVGAQVSTVLGGLEELLGFAV